MTLIINDPDIGKEVCVERNLEEMLLIGEVYDQQSVMDAIEKITGEFAYFSTIRIILEDQLDKIESVMGDLIGKIYVPTMKKARDSGASGNIGDARILSFMSQMGNAGSVFSAVRKRRDNIKGQHRKAKMVENILQQRLIGLSTIAKSLMGQVG